MKSSQHIQFKLLLTMIVLSFSTLILILVPTVQFARNALKQQALDKMALSLESIQTDLEKNIEEAEKIVRKLKMITDDYFVNNEPKTYSDYKLFLDEVEPSVALEAQNHKQSLTAYIYMDPELFNKSLDVYYADQNGNGKVTKQSNIPIEYFLDGPVTDDDKSWWFGPIENNGPFWTLPYDWTMDNGNVLRFMSHTMPVYYKGEFIAVVGTDINYSYLTDKIRSFKILETGYAFLLDKQTKNIYSPSTIDNSGNRISVTKQISNGWVVGISVLESEIYSPIDAFNKIIAISMLITLVLTGIISLLFSYAAYPQDGTNIYQILKKSNIALTQAKAYGKNQIQKYENSFEEKGDQKQEFYRALRFAIKNDEFFLVFQPQMDITSSKVTGIEVLLRWLYNGVHFY